MWVNIPSRYTPQGAIFLCQRVRYGVNARCENETKCGKRPDPTVNATPHLSFGETPRVRACMPCHVCVRDGAVSDAGKGVYFIGNIEPGMWIGNILRDNSKTDLGRRGQRTKYVLDVQTLTNIFRPAS